MNQQYIKNYNNPVDDTDRSGYATGKNPFENSRGIKIPGTKSFHLYNTLLFIFSLFQVVLFAIQGVNSPCSGRKLFIKN